MQAERPLGEHARRAARTYGAAADHYGLAALSFWDRFGAATVAGLPLAAGNTVLDLCCGAGASAIPAARLVGPEGRVLGIDVAESLLDMARARAAREGLANIEFRAGDATGTALPDGGFDAVICVFGVFFVPDMAGFVAEMWRLVRPGGALAITTWGAGLFEPANTVFWESVREVEPSLFKAFNPGMRSPPRPPSRTCSLAAAWSIQPCGPSRAGTSSTTRTGSGTSSSAPATGPPSMPSARNNATSSASTSSAGCGQRASRRCGQT